MEGGVYNAVAASRGDHFLPAGEAGIILHLLKRAIQRYIFDPLAKGILAGQFGDGDTVLVDYPKGSEGLVFTMAAPSPPAGEAVPPRGKKKHAKGEAVEPEVVE